MKKIFLVLTMILMIGCTEVVEPGHLGVCNEGGRGFEGLEVLPPGRHKCYGPRTRLHQIETRDSRQTISINVLAKDKLNMSFDISMLVSVNSRDQKLILRMFSNIDHSGVIRVQDVFDTYAKNLIDQEVRKVISKYETTEISDKRAEIIDEIREKVKIVMENTVMDVKDITINNMDFPDVVTKAQEIKKTREVEIQTEHAEQKKKLLAAQNSLEIAEINAAKQLLEAKSVADSNKIISNSITPEYLEYKRIEAMKEMAKKGDLIMMPYTAETDTKNFKSKVFDINVKKRIEDLSK